MTNSDGDRSRQTSPVEVFSIGRELLIGQIQDSNSFWLAKEVTALGGTMQRISILDDDQPGIVQAFRDAVGRGARTIITTGGLGPTPDDLTVPALAELMEVGIHVDEAVVADHLRRRGITLEEHTPNLKRMATIPDGAVAFPSPAGWAPLIRVDRDECAIFAMPGPPREMEAVFARYLEDYFSSGAGAHRAVTHRVYVDMYESEVAPMLQEVMSAVPGTYCKGYIALGNQRFLPIDVVTRGEDEAHANDALEQALALLERLIREAGRDFQR
ncbi:MAG: competence/damage-inducible protein A [Chloroflexota bacterium]